MWDVGGTLAQHAMPVESFLRRCLARAGLSLDSLAPGAIQAADAVRKQLESLWRTAADEEAGNLEIATALLRDSGASADQVRTVASALLDYFELFTLIPGIRSLLDELRNAGVLQGVVSNWPPSLKGFLDFHDLTRYFKVVVGSGEFGAEKPDPAIFRHALEQLGVPATECVFVGDNPEKDIKPARELGMQAIHFDPRGSWPGADARDAQQLRSLLLRTLKLP